MESSVSNLEAWWAEGRSDVPYDVVDLSQPITPDMAGWRGTERVEVTIETLHDIDHAVPGGSISATHLRMVAHAGTHVDAARHFFPDGKSVDEYDIDQFVCRGVAIDVPRDGPHALSSDELRALDPGIRAGDAVLLHFGYADRYTSDEYYDHPFLTGDAASYLADLGVAVLGADLVTPDCPAHRRQHPFAFPVHTALLRSGAVIVENLGPGIREVCGRPFIFVMAPMRIPGADASPVVPLALVPHDGR